MMMNSFFFWVNAISILLVLCAPFVLIWRRRTMTLERKILLSVVAFFALVALSVWGAFQVVGYIAAEPYRQAVYEISVELEAGRGKELRNAMSAWLTSSDPTPAGLCREIETWRK